MLKGSSQKMNLITGCEIMQNSLYESVLKQLRFKPKKWLITGVAGFIGSNLLETLLKADQLVVGLDNFSTGSNDNLGEVQSKVSHNQWSNFCLVNGDIRHLEDCKKSLRFKNMGIVDIVLHQAALGSVPRSILDPLMTNAVNISGFLNMLTVVKDEGIKNFVYAASSSTYGDHPALPKIEENIGKPLSPYAVTKYVNELYAEVFSRVYGLNSIGLRYFNVFGPRQDPNGAYAAVIPKWINAMLHGLEIKINGDGTTSRDFCFVDNVVQANIMAATTLNQHAKNQVFNIAVGDRTDLSSLFLKLQIHLNGCGISYAVKPENMDFRDGDVRHSQASINKAIELLGYLPTDGIDDGLAKTVGWYVQKFSK